MAEAIQKHELQDIYRLQPGVILIVNKYKPITSWIYSDIRRITKAVKGLKGGLMLKEAYTHNGVTLPAGTILLNRTPVKPITNLREFSMELKLSGGAFHGDYDEHLALYRKVEHILEIYRG